jgi:hypothetical protein
MKNELRSGKRGSKTAAKSQGGTRLLSPQEMCPLSKEFRARNESWLSMRAQKLAAPIDLHAKRIGIWFPELSNAQALDFISLVVMEHESSLRRILDEQKENAFWFGLVADALTAARAAARRAWRDGSKSAPTYEDEKSARCRTPLGIDFSGFTGMIEYGDRRMLSLICSALYHVKDEIDRNIHPNLIGDQSVRLADAMVLVELVVDRDESLQEVEDSDQNGGQTELQKVLRVKQLA